MNTVAGSPADQRVFGIPATYLPRLRVIAVVVFWVGFYLVWGLPSGREETIGAILVSLLLLTAGSSIRQSLVAVVNWMPFIVLMVLYDLTRGAADELGMPIQVGLPIEADKLLCDCNAPATLREWIPTTPRSGYPTAYWYEAVFSITYATHFFLPYITAAVLWFKNEDRFHRFRDTFFLLTFAGLLIYVLVPTTPPWLAGEDGLLSGIDRNSRTVGNGWRLLSVSWAESVLDKGRAVSNPVAALPSLHGAYSLFFTLMIWPRAKWFRKVGSRFYIPGSRPLLVAFPITMLITLVVAAEHYVFDVLVGWLFAVGAVWVFNEARYRHWRAKVSTWVHEKTGLRIGPSSRHDRGAAARA